MTIFRKYNYRACLDYFSQEVNLIYPTVLILTIFPSIVIVLSGERKQLVSILYVIAVGVVTYFWQQSCFIIGCGGGFRDGHSRKVTPALNQITIPGKF